MTRYRGPLCRRCGMPAESTPYCGPCAAIHIRRTRTLLAIIRSLWGDLGVQQYETADRARRLTARRTTNPGRTHP